MIAALQQVIANNWGQVADGDPCDASSLSLTKFCQRIVQEHTKVLFYVTHKDEPLCILKIMRSPAYNEKLKKEAAAQKELHAHGLRVTPKVLFEDTVDGSYVYAENIVSGSPISRRVGEQKEEEIVSVIQEFPTYGPLSSKELYAVFEKHNSNDNEHYNSLLATLGSHDVELSRGLTHSDLGRPNILCDGKNIHFIDWERAHERPVWLIDAVYYMIRLRRISTIDEWNTNASPQFVQYTGVAPEVSEVLYITQTLFQILYNKYQNVYKKVIDEVSRSV